MGVKFTVIDGASRAITVALILVATTGLCRPLRARAPGPELFAKQPQTPLELWDAIDYLLRTGQTKKRCRFSTNS